MTGTAFTRRSGLAEVGLGAETLAETEAWPFVNEISGRTGGAETRALGPGAFLIWADPAVSWLATTGPTGGKAAGLQAPLGPGREGLQPSLLLWLEDALILRS